MPRRMLVVIKALFQEFPLHMEVLDLKIIDCTKKQML